MTKRTGSDMELSPLCIGALEGTGTLFDPQRWGKNVEKNLLVVNGLRIQIPR